MHAGQKFFVDVCTNMKVQRGATGVLERTSHYLRSGLLQHKPAWFDVVGAHPPSINLTKKAKLFETERQTEDPKVSLFQNIDGKYKTRSNVQDRNQKNNLVSRVPKLQFLEDELRDVFYHQHPWEFSRPKVLVETLGDDISKCDWSHMLQFNKPLDGESVVQRTLWLLAKSKADGKPSTLLEAYDHARFEFYRLRMEEEMSSAVSREESSMYGAVFPSPHLEHGINQEQAYIDEWTKVAGDATKVKAASKDGKNANGSMGAEDVVERTKSAWETEFTDEQSV